MVTMYRSIIPLFPAASLPYRPLSFGPVPNKPLWFLRRDVKHLVYLLPDLNKPYLRRDVKHLVQFTSVLPSLLNKPGLWFLWTRSLT